jgi:predicted AlkP superfamily phosphohydrolase/phosphomutase
MSRRVFAVGLDGVPPRLARQGIEEGRLPTLERMREEGVSGTTRSTTPPLSMMAWSTFATGRSPGNHGIYNFILEEEDHRTSFATAERLRRDSVPFWEYLDALGYSTGVVNVMPGYPPARTDGYHVSDHITTPPDGQFAYPAAVQQEIEDSTEVFELGPITGYSAGDGEAALASYVQRFLRIERERAEVSKRLIEDRPTDVTAMVFSGPDVFLHEVGHLLDPDHPAHEPELAATYADAVFELLELYDDFLNWLLAHVHDEDVVMVLSDHGHGSVHTAVNLNSWLYQQGYLSLRPQPSTQAKVFLYNHLFDTAQRTLKRLNLYERVKLGVARSGGAESGPDLAALLTLSTNDIDWDGTDAYTVAGDGQVFVDHEPGTERYDVVREGLAAALRDLHNPKRDEPIVDRVVPGEELYPGSCTDGRPDLVCVPEPGYRFTFPQTMQTNEFLVEPQKWWSHTSRAEMDGVFYMHGGPTGHRDDVEVGLADFAPTMLHLAGAPVPEAMDGTVRGDLLERETAEVRDDYDGKVAVARAARTVAAGLSE